MNPTRISALMGRAVELSSSESASDEERLEAGLFLVATAAASIAGVLWGAAYLAIGRPVSAIFPGGFAVAAIAVCLVLMQRHRVGRLRELVLGLFVLLPVLLQISLGGYEKGSAVVVWAFMAPLGALVFFGVRSALPWLVIFAAAVTATAFADPFLAAKVPPLPPAVQAAFFALNLTGVAALVTVVLAYFQHQRDQAMARSESLLLNVLPPEIATRLKRHEYPIADRFDDLTVLFADLVGFTGRSADEDPEATVAVLNEFLSTFDILAEQHGVRPIRTMGDSYLAVSGMPAPRPDHCEAMADTALAMLDSIARLNADRGWAVNFRIGMNSGSAIAAVVGRRRFTYDVWSDCVNIASRMESTGVPGRIQVTDEVQARLRDRYRFECRGEVEVKGKGKMTTYFLLGRATSDRDPALAGLEI
jgi:class 3 adenylate cyclase